jgi:hypothetical protein
MFASGNTLIELFESDSHKIEILVLYFSYKVGIMSATPLDNNFQVSDVQKTPLETKNLFI